MATEADIPESITIVKSEREDNKSASEPLGVSVNTFPPEEIKKVEDWVIQPAETIHYSEKPEKIPTLTDIEVKNVNAVIQGNVGTIEDEIFLESPSVTKVACEETSRTVDDDQDAQNPNRAEMELAKNEILEEEKLGAQDVEIFAIEETPLEENKQHTSEEFKGSEEDEKIVKTKYEKTELKPDEQTVKISQESVESSQTVKDLTSIEDEIQEKSKSESSLVEQIEDMCFQKVDKPEKVNEVPEIGFEDIVKESQNEVEDQIDILEGAVTANRSLSTTAKDDENEPKVGEENIKAGKSETSKHKEQPVQSFLLNHEPGKEKPDSSLSLASEETGTTASNEHVDPILQVEERRSTESLEEKLEETIKDEKISANDINKTEVSEEKIFSTVELNEKTIDAKVEILNKNADDFHIAHPMVVETVQVGGEKLDDVSTTEIKEVHETIGVPPYDEKHVSQAYEASKSLESAISEHASTEGLLKLPSETSKLEVDKADKVCEFNSGEKLQVEDSVEVQHQKEEAFDPESQGIATKGDDDESTIKENVPVNTLCTGEESDLANHQEDENNKMSEEAVSELNAGDQSCRTDNETENINDPATKEEVYKGPEIADIDEDTKKQIIKYHTYPNNSTTSTREETTKCSQLDQIEAKKPKAETEEELGATSAEESIERPAIAEENIIQDQSIISIEEEAIVAEMPKQEAREILQTADGEAVIREQIKEEDGSAKDNFSEAAGEETKEECSYVKEKKHDTEVSKITNEGQDILEQIKEKIEVENSFAESFKEKTVQEATQDDEVSKEYETFGESTITERQNIEDNVVGDLPSLTVREEKVENSSKEDESDVIKLKEESIEQNLKAIHPTEEKQHETIPDEAEPDENSYALTTSATSKEETSPNESNECVVENSSRPEAYEKEMEVEVLQKAVSPEEISLKEAEAEDKMFVGDSHPISEETDLITAESDEIKDLEKPIAGEHEAQNITYHTLLKSDDQIEAVPGEKNLQEDLKASEPTDAKFASAETTLVAETTEENLGQKDKSTDPKDDADMESVYIEEKNTKEEFQDEDQYLEVERGSEIHRSEIVEDKKSLDTGLAEDKSDNKNRVDEASQAQSTSSLKEENNESIQSNATLPDSNETKVKEESDNVKDQNTESSEEQFIGGDIPETIVKIAEETKPIMEAEDQINKNQDANERTDAISAEEVLPEVEKVDKSENIKEQIIEEESCTKELDSISVADEMVNEVKDRDLELIPNLEAADPTDDTETVTTKVDEDLNQESEVSPRTNASEEETRKASEERQAEEVDRVRLDETNGMVSQLQTNEENAENDNRSTKKSISDETVQENKTSDLLFESKDQIIEELHEAGTSLTVGKSQTTETEEKIKAVPETQSTSTLKQENIESVESEATLPESNETEIKEESDNVKDQSSGSSEEQFIGQDIPEATMKIAEETKPIIQAEDQINKNQDANERTKNVILAEEVLPEVEKADNFKNIKEQIIEEESCTKELHPLSVADETVKTVNEIKDQDLESIPNLEEADPTEDRETVITKDEEDLNRTEATLTTNPSEEETRKAIEKPIQAEEVGSVKLEETHGTVSRLQTNVEETAENDNISTMKSNSVEDKDQESKTSGIVLESKDLGPEEPHEAGTSPAAEKIETTETEDEIKEVPETVSESEFHSVEAVSVGANIPDQSLPAEKPEEQLHVPSSTLLSTEHEHESMNTAKKIENEGKKSHETELASTELEETSSVVSQLSTTECQNAESVIVEETEIPSGVFESRVQIDEKIQDTVASPAVERTEIVKNEEKIKEVPESISERAYQGMEAVTDGEKPDKLQVPSTASLPEEEDHETTNEIEKIEDEAEVNSIKLQESSAMVSQLSTTEAENAVDVSVSVEKKEAEVEETKTCEAVFISKSLDVEEEIHETMASKEVPETTSEPKSQAVGIVSDGETLHDQTLQAGKSEEQLQVAPTASLSKKDVHGTPTTINKTEDESFNIQETPRTVFQLSITEPENAEDVSATVEKYAVEVEEPKTSEAVFLSKTLDVEEESEETRENSIVEEKDLDKLGEEIKEVPETKLEPIYHAVELVTDREITPDHTLQAGKSEEELWTSSSNSHSKEENHETMTIKKTEDESTKKDELEVDSLKVEHNSSAISNLSTIDPENADEVEVEETETSGTVFASKDRDIVEIHETTTSVTGERTDPSQNEEEIKEVPETISKNADEVEVEETKNFDALLVAKDEDIAEIHKTSTSSTVEKTDANKMEEETKITPEKISQPGYHGVETVCEGEITSDQTLEDGKPKEQLEVPSSSDLLSKEEDHETTTTIEKIEDESTKNETEVDIKLSETSGTVSQLSTIEPEKGDDLSLTVEKEADEVQETKTSSTVLVSKDRDVEDIHVGTTSLAVEKTNASKIEEEIEEVPATVYHGAETVTEGEITTDQTLQSGKSEEKLQTPSSASHSKEEGHETATTIEALKIEEQSKEVPETVPKPENHGDEAVIEGEITPDHTLTAGESEEQLKVLSTALLSRQEDHETATAIELIANERLRKDEVDSMKLQDASGMVSNDRDVEVEVEETKTSNEVHVSEERGIEEIHETSTSLTVEKTDANKMEEEIKIIPETISNPEYHGVETVTGVEITSDQTPQDGKPEEQLEVPSPTDLLSKEEDHETATTIEKMEDERPKEDETKVDSVKLQETSGMVSQLARIEPEKGDEVSVTVHKEAAEVQEAKTSSTDTVFVSKERNVEEIHEATTSLTVEKTDDEIAPDQIFQSEESKTKLEVLSSASVTKEEDHEMITTIETIEDKSTNKEETEVCQMKLEEDSSVVTQIPIAEPKNADNVSVTVDKEVYEVEVGENKSSDTICVSKDRGVEEIFKTGSSLTMEKIDDTDTIPKEINEDETTKEDESDVDSAKLEETSAVVLQIPQIESEKADNVSVPVENLNGDEIEVEEIKTSESERESKDQGVEGIHETQITLAVGRTDAEDTDETKEVPETIVEKIGDESSKKDDAQVNESLDDQLITSTIEERSVQKDPREIEVSDSKLKILEEVQDIPTEAPKEESTVIEQVSTLEHIEKASEIKYVESTSKCVERTVREILTGEEGEKCDEASNAELEMTIKVLESASGVHSPEAFTRQEEAKSKEVQFEAATTELGTDETPSEETTEANETAENKISSDKENAKQGKEEKEVPKDSDRVSCDEETVPKSDQEDELLQKEYPGEKMDDKIDVTKSEIPYKELSEDHEETGLDKTVKKIVTVEVGAVKDNYQVSAGNLSADECLSQEAKDGKNVEKTTEVDPESQGDETHRRETVEEAVALHEEVNSSDSALEKHDDDSVDANDKETVTKKAEEVIRANLEVPPKTYAVAEAAPDKTVSKIIEEVAEPATKEPVHEIIKSNEENKNIATAATSISESLRDNEKPVHALLENVIEGLNLKEQGIYTNEPITSPHPETSQKEIADKESTETVDEKQNDFALDKQTIDEVSILVGEKSTKYEEELPKDEKPIEHSTTEEERSLNEAEIQSLIASNAETENQAQHEDLKALDDIKDSDLVISQRDTILDIAKVKEITRDIQEVEKTTLAVSDEQIARVAHPDKSREATISTYNHEISLVQPVTTAKTFQQAEVEELKHGNASGAEPEEKQVQFGEKKTTDDKCDETTEKSTSAVSDKMSLSDFLPGVQKENQQVVEHLTEERELIINKEEPQTLRAESTQVEEAKTDEREGDEHKRTAPQTEIAERALVEEAKIDGKTYDEEGDEHKTTDSGSDAPVMVEASRDMDVKIAHKKSHNILSGVGSKVKHSIAKVKKVITGKSTHPKPPSPK